MKRRAAVATITAVATSAALLGASACTSIPISTMWRFRSFKLDDFFALDPTALRAAVRTHERATYAGVDIELKTTLKDEAPVQNNIRLQSLVGGDARLEPAPAERRWQVFALGPEGVKLFEQTRQYIALARNKPGSSIAITVRARESVVPPELARALPMRLDLLLDPKEGWFTMFAETKVDTTKKS